MSPEAHGGLDQRWLNAHGVNRERLIDFSTNVNPYGPSPRAIRALEQLDPAPYPDRSVNDLTTLLARSNDVDPERVLVGNGASQLIWLVAGAFLDRRHSVLVAGPTFGEYARAAEAKGAEVQEVFPTALESAHALVDMQEAVRTVRPTLVFLCNPNNPTGAYIEESRIAALAHAVSPGLLVVDEAYRAFLGSSAFGPPVADNVLLIRSLTKEYALAGLRLGYAIGRPPLIRRLARHQPPWSVNAAAQAAGLAALGDEEHLRVSLEATRRAAEALKLDLISTGARVIPSPLHYFLVRVGDASAFRGRLLSKGFLVRDCSSFGLPAYIRIGARKPDENKALVAAWARVDAGVGESPGGAHDGP